MGESAGFFTTFSTDAHTAHLDFVELRACAVPHGCHFFVIPQRNGERKGTRTFPPGPPSFAALQSETREITYKLLMLCLKFSQHERQAEKARDIAFLVGVGVATIRFKGNSIIVERMGWAP